MSILYSNISNPHQYRKFFVKNYQVDMLIGFLDHEKITPQKVVFNIEVLVKISDSTSLNDNVEEVFNYDVIIQSIEKHTQKHYNLQETLCDDIFDELYQNKYIQGLCINMYKQQAYPKAQGMGVERFKVK